METVYFSVFNNTEVRCFVAECSIVYRAFVAAVFGNGSCLLVDFYEKSSDLVHSVRCDCQSAGVLACESIQHH